MTTLTEFLLARIAEDEARVLAECEARRRIVEIAKSSESGEVGWYLTFDLALKAITLPYADHPDYDPTWRP